MADRAKERPISKLDAQILVMVWSQHRFNDGRGMTRAEIHTMIVAALRVAPDAASNSQEEELDLEPVKKACTKLEKEGRLFKLESAGLGGPGRTPDRFIINVDRLPMSRTVAEIAVHVVSLRDGPASEQNELVAQIVQTTKKIGEPQPEAEVLKKIEDCVRLGYLNKTQDNGAITLVADRRKVHNDREYLDQIRIQHRKQPRAVDFSLFEPTTGPQTKRKKQPRAERHPPDVPTLSKIPGR